MKQIALLISVCYLACPLQQQIIIVLHEISHGLEMPSTILSHHEYEQSFTEVHTQHSHENDNAEHQHTFIDVIDTVFAASNENHESDKVPFSEVKLKKHITSDILALPKKFMKEILSEFYLPQMAVNAGHLEELDAPPKSNLL